MSSTSIKSRSVQGGPYTSLWWVHNVSYFNFISKIRIDATVHACGFIIRHFSFFYYVYYRSYVAPVIIGTSLVFPDHERRISNAADYCQLLLLLLFLIFGSHFRLGKISIVNRPTAIFIVGSWCTPPLPPTSRPRLSTDRYPAALAGGKVLL